MRDSLSESRRRFLSVAGVSTLAAAGMTVPSAAHALTDAPVTTSGKMPEPIKLPPQKDDKKLEKLEMPTFIAPEQRVGIALVGLGRLTLEELLPAFGACKRARVTALVSGDVDKAKRTAAMYGIPETSLYSYDTFEQLRDNAAVQAVYIVLPNSMHADFTLRAARAGKHVLCEKPMATSVADAERMIAACASAQKKLMIAYRVQYEPRHRLMMQWARAKDFLGELKVIEMQNSHAQSRENPNQWRLKRALAGGGALPDLGIYCFNTARFLTGEEPVEVGATSYSTNGDARFREVEETVSWWMRFPSGVIASCVSSYGAAEVQRYRIQGTKGWAEMDPGFSYRGLKLRRGRTSDDVAAKSIEELAMPEQNQFALELDHFAECITSDKKPYTPGEEGLQDHRVLAAIYEAVRTGKTVSLPPVKGLDAFRGPPPKAPV